MPTFVEAVQSVARDDVQGLERRFADRLEAVGEAVGVLESWTEESDATRAELASKYDTAKSLARDEIRESDDASDDVAPEDLLSHPAVSEDTKRRLSEYGTKLHAFLDAERSYGAAREELRTALADELSLYRELLEALGPDVTVRDAQQAVARFAREDALGSPNRTATDVLLASAAGEGESAATDGDEESEAADGESESEGPGAA